MEELFSYQNKILSTINDEWYRAAYRSIDWTQRLFGIKGLRGVGKTTLLLQHLKYHYTGKEKALYVSADNPWFYNRNLYELITEFDKLGGELLLIDEIHKYPKWPNELKVAYDAHPDMQFIFSASSAFDIFRAEADLSRRAAVIHLPGLSFREFLEYKYNVSFPVINLEQLLINAAPISREINEKIKPILRFREYLMTGYFPFLKNEPADTAKQKLAAIVNAVLENDLAYIQDYSPSNIQKIKKLLGIIAGTAPFTPNISKIADKLNVGRNTIYNYLKHLEDAHILKLAHKAGRGISALQKPDKVYFENTNLAIALNNNPETGALRETFFINQIHNAGHTIHLAKQGDFIIDDHITVEIGGKHKTLKQIADLDNAFVVNDHIEYAFKNHIPLWMFGFLY